MYQFSLLFFCFLASVVSFFLFLVLFLVNFYTIIFIRCIGLDRLTVFFNTFRFSSVFLLGYLIVSLRILYYLIGTSLMRFLSTYEQAFRDADSDPESEPIKSLLSR